MKKYGHFTNIIFLPSFEKAYSQDVINSIIRLVSDSEVIGITCMSGVSKKAEQIAKSLKPLGKIIVWGGIHATLNPEECLEFADFVCVGEGEEAMLELVNIIKLGKGKSGKGIAGMKNFCQKRRGRVVKNPLRSLVSELDRLPFPDNDFNEKYILCRGKLVPLAKHHLMIGEFNIAKSFLKRYSCFAFLHTSRGCPYSCSYCCNSSLKVMYNHQGCFTRARSVRNIMAELCSLKHKIPELEYIWFTDDSFFMRTNKEIDLFRNLYKQNIGLPFMCYGHPLNITPDKLWLLVDAGLNYTDIGVQTGSEQLNREVYNRYVSNSQILNTASLLNKYSDRLIVEYQIITTNPYENEKDIIKTIRLLARLPKPYRLSRFNMVFFPGSRLYHKANKDGLISGKKESYYNLPYSDFVRHIKNKRLGNAYLYYIIRLMGMKVTKRRYGIIPAFMLRLLINNRVVRVCNSSRIISMLMFPIIVVHNYFYALPPSIQRICVRLKVFNTS